MVGVLMNFSLWLLWGSKVWRTWRSDYQLEETIVWFRTLDVVSCDLKIRFPVDDVKKGNENAQPKKDIFLNPKVQNKKHDINLMLKFYHISTDLLTKSSLGNGRWLRFLNEVK